jgi:[DsrC]-trisulfide reductase subunit M
VNGFSMFVGGVLPYVTIVIFLAGMIYRFKVWFNTPQPGKMTLFTNQGESTAKSVLAEALFFPSLFRGDKTLWFFSWVFHVTLALVFVGHLRVFSGFIDVILGAMGMSDSAINIMSATTGGGAGVVLLVTGLFLLIRRFAIKRVREISGIPDFFALLLVLAVIITGDLMRVGEHFDLALTRTWAASLLTFSPNVPSNSTFLVHAMLAQFLFIYIPFSKILHFGGIFFTQALIKRR